MKGRRSAPFAGSALLSIRTPSRIILLYNVSMLASSPRSLSRSPGLRWALAVGLLYVAVLYLHFSFPGAIWGQHAISNPTISIVSNGPCAGYESFDRLVITVKTGATEALGKIPTQLQTSLRCVPPENVLLFSDMAQEIGDRHVFDSLDMIPVETMAMNSDFDIYREQQKLKDPGQIIDRLKSMKDPNNSDNLAAWSLDKYKNLHIVEKSWALNPSDWYLHIDADTYIVWSSLTAWLRRMNSSKEFNIGSMACIGSRAFCHGGSGILLSGAASRSLAVKHNGTSARWYERTKEICCGDFVLAQALDEYGIGVSNAWPVINGETPSTIPFSQEIWCLPLVTMHHVTSSEAEQLYKFEQKRANKSVCGQTFGWSIQC